MRIADFVRDLPVAKNWRLSFAMIATLAPKIAKVSAWKEIVLLHGDNIGLCLVASKGMSRNWWRLFSFNICLQSKLRAFAKITLSIVLYFTFRFGLLQYGRLLGHADQDAL